MPTLIIRHCVICDDVRLEVSNKETIVGVYPVGVSVPFFPWFANICIWMPVIWSGDGELYVEVRILDTAKEQIGIVGGNATAMWSGFESSLTFRGLSVTLNMEGFHSVEWRAAGGAWQHLRHFPVYLPRGS